MNSHHSIKAAVCALLINVKKLNTFKKQLPGEAQERIVRTQK